MIDYDKLKIAHELADKYEQSVSGSVCVTVQYRNIENNPIYELRHFELQPEFKIIDHITHSFWCIDDLITKLEDLTKPKPKYEVGQAVYWLADKNIYSYDVKKIHFEGQDILYSGDYEELYEPSLYPSRESLIDAQIEYWINLKREYEPLFIGIWKSLKNNESSTSPDDMSMTPEFEGDIEGFNKCQHESNGFSYASHPPQNKCIKCEEFYR